MYKASDVPFPKLPGERAAKVATDKDMDKWNDGFTNPDLFRLYEPDPVPFAAPEPGKPVPFDPYQRKPQFELSPRTYKLYVSGGNSYRLMQIHNHDENSTFWEIP